MLRQIEISDTAFPREWERCEDFLEPALAYHQTHDMNDVLGQVLCGAAQFWAGDGCAGVTELLIAPKKRILRLWLAGGDLGELVESEPSVLDFARARGCGAVQIDGRGGWLRVLEGYTVLHTTIGKDL